MNEIPKEAPSYLRCPFCPGMTYAKSADGPVVSYYCVLHHLVKINVHELPKC